MLFLLCKFFPEIKLQFILCFLIFNQENVWTKNPSTFWALLKVNLILQQLTNEQGKANGIIFTLNRPKDGTPSWSSRESCAAAFNPREMLIGLAECALYKCAVIISLAKLELNLYVYMRCGVRARFSPLQCSAAQSALMTRETQSLSPFINNCDRWLIVHYRRSLHLFTRLFKGLIKNGLLHVTRPKRRLSNREYKHSHS